MKLIKISFVLLVLAFAGCGSAAKYDKDGAFVGSKKCPRVLLGVVDGDKTYALPEEMRNVRCEVAQAVVREWGRQQEGIVMNARLPDGWSCDVDDCKHGNSSVVMTLIFP